MQASIHVFNPIISGSNPLVAQHPDYTFQSTLLSNRTDGGSLKTLSSIAAANNHQHIDILRMDLERTEFKIVPSIFADPLSPSIDQILVSVHNNKPMPYAYLEWIDMVKTLESAGYEIVGVEFNPGMATSTSCFWEVVFVKRSSGLLLV